MSRTSKVKHVRNEPTINMKQFQLINSYATWQIYENMRGSAERLWWLSAEHVWQYSCILQERHRLWRWLSRSTVRKAVEAHVSLKWAGLCKTLVTDTTAEWTLACVCTDMSAQVPNLSECFVTHRTDKGLFSQMHCSLVPTHAPAELEPHWALRASIRLVGTVHALVSSQMAQHYKFSSTFIAAEPTNAFVHCKMCREKPRVAELASTVGTDVWCSVRMGACVVLQSASLCKSFVTSGYLAVIWPLSCVNSHMNYQHCGCAEPPTTDAAHVLTVRMHPTVRRGCDRAITLRFNFLLLQFWRKTHI